jgi:hypothetical protein
MDGQTDSKGKNKMSPKMFGRHNNHFTKLQKVKLFTNHAPSKLQIVYLNDQKSWQITKKFN